MFFLLVAAAWLSWFILAAATCTSLYLLFFYDGDELSDEWFVR